NWMAPPATGRPPLKTTDPVTGYVLGNEPPLPHPAAVSATASRTALSHRGHVAVITAPPRERGPHQSLPRIPPSRGSQAPAQVAAMIACEPKRTLPAPRPTFVPPVCPDWPRLGSQPPNGVGFTWNMKQAA